MRSWCISRMFVLLWALALIALCGQGFLVPGAAAADASRTFLDDWVVVQTGQTVHVDIPSMPRITLPTSFALNPSARGSYTGPCPIGTRGPVDNQLAPQLKNPGLSSGALCRGACGADCPSDRCTSVPDIVIPISSGTCTYAQVQSCPVHQGCKEHDACYDYCTEALKEYDSGIITMLGNRLTDTCHSMCDSRCFDTYGFVTCSRWSGKLGSAVGIADATPAYYSDPPTFEACPRGTSVFPSSEGQCCPPSAPYYFAGSCVECPAGQTYDTTQGRCRSLCEGSTPWYYDGSCHAGPPGETTTNAPTRAVTRSPTVQVTKSTSSGSCSDGYYVYSTSAGHCCKEGYPYYYNGVCNTKPQSSSSGTITRSSSGCSSGYYVYSTSAGKCCRDGYPYYYSNTCHQCQQGYLKYTTSSGHCCKEGYPYYYNGVCNTRPSGSSGQSTTSDCSNAQPGSALWQACQLAGGASWD